MYVCERVEMFNRIRNEGNLDVEQMDQDNQMQILIGIGWKDKEKQIRNFVLQYMKKAYEKRKIYT